MNEPETVTMTDEMSEYLAIKACYMDIFRSDAGQKVLKDLEVQSYFEAPLFHGDVNKMLINEGARLLFMRIKDLALSPMPKVSDN